MGPILSHGLIGIFAIVDLEMTSSGQKMLFHFFSNMMIFPKQFRSFLMCYTTSKTCV